ncbi:hypothetical protein BO85DRAFT_187646 [Aspergillus piperis CBS 112811]|uniref:Uncharacterized protein n=1 Tax=Aspergillus piperis CBS 112811 TaxID=1448313 RepID=A0A8G1RAB5_9EURO|nr:hypothetical protein BO85DRAFT_187646 [Aspergillus piperis CBS 112811]RAH61094.1 hypothetical protein BO85DRAFT_187646 [Aspergillus piperis CBS 112811]
MSGQLFLSPLLDLSLSLSSILFPYSILPPHRSVLLSYFDLTTFPFSISCLFIIPVLSDRHYFSFLPLPCLCFAVARSLALA